MRANNHPDPLPSPLADLRRDFEHCRFLAHYRVYCACYALAEASTSEGRHRRALKKKANGDIGGLVASGAIVPVGTIKLPPPRVAEILLTTHSGRDVDPKTKEPAPISVEDLEKARDAA